MKKKTLKAKTCLICRNKNIYMLKFVGRTLKPIGVNWRFGLQNMTRISNYFFSSKLMVFLWKNFFCKNSQIYTWKTKSFPNFCVNKTTKIVMKSNRLLHTIRPLDGFGTALSSPPQAGCLILVTFHPWAFTNEVCTVWFLNPKP